MLTKPSRSSSPAVGKVPNHVIRHGRGEEPEGAEGCGLARVPRGANDDGRTGREHRYKRVFDLCVVVLLLVALLPLWIALCAAIALAIRLESGGPVLFRQVRLGLDGRPFRILKFRTMLEGDASPDDSPVCRVRREAHTTPVGRALRRFHLDELPQVVNVIRGEMSLVGPRPERPALAARIEREVPGFSRRLQVRPGLMGLAQVRCLYDCRPRCKLHYDELYIRRMSLFLDIRLIVACVVRELIGSKGDVPRCRSGR